MKKLVLCCLLVVAIVGCSADFSDGIARYNTVYTFYDADGVLVYEFRADSVYHSEGHTISLMTQDGWVVVCMGEGWVMKKNGRKQ